MHVSARAVLLTSDGFVLLMKVRGRAGDLWITPGGRIRPGEDPIAAVAREIREETSRTGLDIRGEIWVRHGTYLASDGWREEREHFFLVPSERFEPTTAGMEEKELTRHGGFKWWSIPEIADSPEAFVPPGMAELLENLRREGAPARVLDVSG